jgi:hypothetical protein
LLSSCALPRFAIFLRTAVRFFDLAMAVSFKASPRGRLKPGWGELARLSLIRRADGFGETEFTPG